MNKVVQAINACETDLKALGDEQLQAKTAVFKQRLQQGESLGQLLPEAFAVVREASRRTLGLRHFDVQLLGGIALHEGRIAEMRTGEGKTLVATLPIYLNALTGKGTHVVTVNDYLAKRDAEWMAPIYRFWVLPSAPYGLARSLRPNAPPIVPTSLMAPITNLVSITCVTIWLFG